MSDQTKALVYKYITGAAVAALGGAVGALTTMLDAGPVPNFKVLGLAMLVGAGAALRLWVTKQTSSIPAIFGITKSFGDKVAASPDEYKGEADGILYKAMLPNLDSTQPRFGQMAVSLPPPDYVEVRKFSDPRLQEAIEHVFENSGGKNGMFFNVNLNGEVRAGIAVKVGGHLSVGGFFEKKPGLKIEGLLEATYAF